MWNPRPLPDITTTITIIIEKILCICTDAQDFTALRKKSLTRPILYYNV